MHVIKRRLIFYTRSKKVTGYWEYLQIKISCQLNITKFKVKKIDPAASGFFKRRLIAQVAVIMEFMHTFMIGIFRRYLGNRCQFMPEDFNWIDKTLKGTAAQQCRINGNVGTADPIILFNHRKEIR